MEWKEVTLGDFMQCNPKRTIKKGQKARKITMDLLIPHSKTIRNWNYEPYSGGAKFQNGDTIMARITPCLENGKHAFVSILDEGEIAYGSTEYFVFCGKEKVSDNDFVYYLTKTPLFRDTAIKSMVGSSGRQRAQMDVLENLKMFVPKDISDQRRIASVLSSLDRKIELNNKINADLEEMAQAIFKNWFVDFEPFKDGKFVDSELGMIPEGWKVGGLFDIAEIFDKKRKPLSGNVREKMDKIYPYYGATSCMDYVDDYIFDGIYTLIGEDGSVVKENGLPYMQYVWGKMWVNNHAHILQGKNGYSTEMIHALLSITNIKFLVTGAVQAKLSQGNMQKIFVAIPPKNVLDEIRPVIDNLYSKIRINTDENSRLSLLRDTLLPRLMSGELEVPE